MVRKKIITHYLGFIKLRKNKNEKAFAFSSGGLDFFKVEIGGSFKQRIFTFTCTNPLLIIIYFL